ncbi:Phosphate metabolism transcription protein [Bachmanniomyces sp. S44760]|nr:Phosphate metabolism transcription protein [Bachmanniomyces sp. S44760]
MRFGKTLKNSIYQPWRDDYIDYAKLKQLLREDQADNGTASSKAEDHGWTEEEEGAFVDELVNVQLEKVHNFQANKYQDLRERTARCESSLEEAVGRGRQVANDKSDASDESKVEQKVDSDVLQKVQGELDKITEEMNELEKYSRINFTGFLKAAKKHDRKRGTNYKVRPTLLQVRLAALPFNSEDYSPLLYRLSAMYSFIRQNTSPKTEDLKPGSVKAATGEKYKSFKFWVHPENLLEVKTYILRRLPVLIYNPQTSKIVDASQSDPTITSVYFDNPKFSLYTKKVDRSANASSVRLRWSGHLHEKPEILLEKKSVIDDDHSEEIKFPIKEKNIQSFIRGDYKLEKSVRKLRERHGNDSSEVEQLERNVELIQSFIRENKIQPVLRANYVRTAFQIPGDDRLRISVDTNLALIREDSLDTERPCRDPADWHRLDIDKDGTEFPFDEIRKGEKSIFQYALLEIKVKDGGKKAMSEWVSDLMSSHLVREAPRFSKFVHGVALLFEDYVNIFPFWLTYLDTDIRRDPADAFQDEQEKKAKIAEDEFAVGSFVGSQKGSAFQAAIGSPVGKTPALQFEETSKPKDRRRSQLSDGKSDREAVSGKHDHDEDGAQMDVSGSSTLTGFRSLFPSFSTSKYARARRQGRANLPPGVWEPIPTLGEVKVEPKVWLAASRTFIKNQHIAVLLAALSLSLYNAAGESNNLARGLGIAYTLIAVFTGMYGLRMHIIRSRMIEQRSGKDFDNILGPVVICLSLIIALCLNFALKLRQRGVA